MIKSDIKKKFYVDFLNKSNDLPIELNERIANYLKYHKLPWNFVYHPLNHVIHNHNNNALCRLLDIARYLGLDLGMDIDSNIEISYVPGYVSLETLSKEFEINRDKLQMFSSEQILLHNHITNFSIEIGNQGDICCDIFGIIEYEAKNPENYESEIRSEINDICLFYGNTRHSNDFLKNKLDLVIYKCEKCGKPNQYLIGSLNTFYPIPMVSIQYSRPKFYLNSSEKIKLIGAKVTYIYLNANERRHIAIHGCYFGLEEKSIMFQSKLGSVIALCIISEPKMKNFSELKSHSSNDNYDKTPNNLIMM